MSAVQKDASVAQPRDNDALDARARRAAARSGLRATKSTWRAGTIDNRGGFMLADPLTNAVVVGHRFGLTAEDVIDRCREIRAQRSDS